MSTWVVEKGNFEQRKTELDSHYSDQQVESLVNGMNQSILRYTNRAGIRPAGSNTDVDYHQARNNFKKLIQGQADYQILVKQMSDSVAGIANDADIESKLRQIGQLKDDILQMEKTLQDVKQDMNTSKSRQDSVEKTREQVTFYQGLSPYLGFVKPIHPTSIPFLLGFGILLLFFSGLLLKEFFGVEGSSSIEGYEGDGESIFGFFTDSRFYAASGGVTFVVVVLSILAYSGYLGKTV